MIRQKAISLKIDMELLEQLDAEAALGWRKRNNHINEAIRFYLEYKDAYRTQQAHRGHPLAHTVVEDFTKKWFPE